MPTINSGYVAMLDGVGDGYTRLYNRDQRELVPSGFSLRQSRAAQSLGEMLEVGQVIARPTCAQVLANPKSTAADRARCSRELVRDGQMVVLTGNTGAAGGEGVPGGTGGAATPSSSGMGTVAMLAAAALAFFAYKRRGASVAGLGGSPAEHERKRWGSMAAVTEERIEGEMALEAGDCAKAYKFLLDAHMSAGRAVVHEAEFGAHNVEQNGPRMGDRVAMELSPLKSGFKRRCLAR